MNTNLKPPKMPSIPTWKGVAISNLTQKDMAEMKAHMLALKRFPVFTGKLQGGHVGIGYGHAPSPVPSMPMQGQTPEHKQPQDGVIRMVTHKSLQNLLITSMVVYQTLSLAIGCVAGVMAMLVGWPALIFILIAPILGVATRFMVKLHLDNATAKADLLDWPKQ